MESLQGRGPVAATVAGAGVGILGGLLGLGGAEFRLPLLVAIFRYPLRRAVSLNLAISFVAVVVAAVSRWLLAQRAPLAATVAVALSMTVGGMTGAALGARWLTRISDERLHAAVRTLLVFIGAILILEAVMLWTSAGLAGAQSRKARWLLIAYAPADGVKVLLGVVLIASALRVFRARP